MFVPDAVLDHVREVSDEPDLSATKYRLIGPLGRGGMGAVYVAHDSELDREVAIKVSTAVRSDAEIAQRLRREARIVARLEHPAIVPVHDVGVLPDGRIFYVMKRVQGDRLDRFAKAHPERRALLRLFSRICEAVAFAHTRGVIHRDLKPENVMIGELGEALVMDWGIARELGAPVSASSERDRADAALGDTIPAGGDTAVGTVMGTPAYMPPEQARGDVESLDARSDVYSLGAILWFLLARRPPFEGATAAEVLERVKENKTVRLRAIDAEIARPLESICAKAMAPSPADRYASAVDLARDVEHYLDLLPVSAHRDTPLEIAARFVSRHRVILSLAAVYFAVRALVALLGG